MPPACTGNEPLGLESGLVLNQQMTASSQKSSLYAPFNARLNRRKVQERKGGWSPLRSNTNEYLQIDFNQNVKITRVATQGRRDWNEWVITYTLQYSADGQSSFQTYQESGIDKVSSGDIFMRRMYSCSRCRDILSTINSYRCFPATVTGTLLSPILSCSQ